PRDMTDQLRDRSPLLRWIAMVEFKDDRIALAAIGAGMSGEVVVNLLTALLAVELPLRSGAFQICRPVPSIVFARVGGLAGAAFRRSRSAFLVLDRELTDWLGHAARTTSARAVIGPWCHRGFFESNEKRLVDELRKLGRMPQQLGPAKLPCGFPPMAVCAAHIALLDLRQDLRPRFAARQPRDLSALGRWIAVVEVKQHRIAHTT